MRITTFFSEALGVDRDGIARDRRGGSGTGSGGEQRRQSRQDGRQPSGDGEPLSIGSLLGEALGQYHGSTAFEYSL